MSARNRLCATSCLIGEPLALGTLERDLGALGIVDPKPLAVAVPKIKLVAVPVKVLLAHDLVHTDEPALEDAEIAFKRVGVHVATHPFLFGVVNLLVDADV